MTKPAKLYTLLLQSTNRSIAYRDFTSLLEAFGFEHARTRGSHETYKHAKCPKILVLQPLGKDTKRYQLREFLDLVEEYGLYIDR